MECVAVFGLRLFVEGFSTVASMNDGRTVALVGQQDQKEKTRYLAYLASVDPFTASVAAARGYHEHEGLACSIQGRPAKVYFQVRIAPRA